MAGYEQQHNQFTSGASTLDRLGDDIRGQGGAAGNINMGTETFGLIGTLVSKVVLDNAGQLADNISELGTACDEHAAGLRDNRDRYTGQEVNSEHNIRAQGEGLGKGN
jgi:hypothetical protein